MRSEKEVEWDVIRSHYVAAMRKALADAKNNFFGGMMPESFSAETTPYGSAGVRLEYKTPGEMLGASRAELGAGQLRLQSGLDDGWGEFYALAKAYHAHDAAFHAAADGGEGTTVLGEMVKRGAELRQRAHAAYLKAAERG